MHFEDVPIKCPKQFLYYIEFICRRACDKKNSSLNFMSLVGFQASKIWMFFFGKFTVEQVLKSFSGRNNSLKPPVFWSCDSLPYDLEKSKELRALISWLSVYKHSKIQKISAKNFFCVFLRCYYGFTNYFDISIFLFSIIPGGVPTC